MINLLEFSMNHEFKHAWNASARTCYFIFENLTDCMLIYKYKLSDPYIFYKFGTGDPDRIDFEKLDGKSIFLFHLDIYRQKVEHIKNLIDFSIEKNIDIYIPWCNPKNDHWFSEEDQYKIKFKEILDNYNYNCYDFTNMKYNKESELYPLIIERTKLILRDIKLKNLLD